MKIVVKDSYLSTRPKQVEGKVVPKYAFHTVKPKHGGVLLYSGTQSNVLKRDERCGVNLRKQTDNKVLKQEGVVTPIPNLVIGATIGVDLGVNPVGCGYCPTNNRVYFQTSSGGTFYVANPETNTVETSFSGGSSSTGTSKMVFCPLNNSFYVSHGFTITPNRITLVNCSNNSATPIIDVGGISAAFGLEYCPTNQKLYFSNTNSTVSSSVGVLDPLTNTVSGHIQFPSSGTVWDIVYCPTNDRLYSSQSPAIAGQSGVIRVINPQTNAIVANIQLDPNSGPRAIEYCPLTDELFVVTSGDRKIYAINPHTNTIRDKRDITLSDVLRSPVGIAYNPAHGRLHVSHSLITTQVPAFSSVDPYSLVIERYIPTAQVASPQILLPTRSTYCPTNKKMYVGNALQVADPSFQNFVTVLDYTY